MLSTLITRIFLLAACCEALLSNGTSLELDANGTSSGIIDINLVSNRVLSDSGFPKKTRNIIIVTFFTVGFLVKSVLFWVYCKKPDREAFFARLPFKERKAVTDELPTTADPVELGTIYIDTGVEPKSLRDEPSNSASYLSRVGSAPPHGINMFSYHSNNRGGESPPEMVLSSASQANMRVVTYEYLQYASDMFANKLGEGGFGAVFKGSMVLESGRTIHVAIKHLNSDSQQGFKELWTEVTMLWRLRQSNLVPVLAVCPDPCCIVYPLMENGSLLSHLEDSTKRAALGWRDRISIMLDVAAGLVFLHDKNVVHRDIKPANILLSNNMGARLSDFGIARVLNTVTSARTDPIGSFMYMDPTYLSSGILSRHSDMYSFGVVGLQLLTGTEERSIPGLRNTVQTAAENNDLHSIIDQSCTSWPDNIAADFTDLMVTCTLLEPKGRKNALECEVLVRGWLDSAPSAPAAANVTWECLVCLESQRTELFKPCMHCVCCSTCADLVYTSVLPQCPLCREVLTGVVPGGEGGQTYTSI